MTNGRPLTSLLSFFTSVRRPRTLARGLLRGQTGITAGTNLALMALGLATGSLAAHLLGPTGRGQLAAIQLWPVMAAALGSGGLLEAVTYFCGREADRSRAVAITGLGLLAVLAPIIVLIGVIAMPHLLAAEPASVVVEAQVYMLVVPVLFAVNVTYGTLRGIGEFRLWNPWRLSQPAGYACILVLALPVGSQFRVAFIAFGFCLLLVAHLLFVAWVFRRKLQGGWSFRQERVAPLVRYGLLSLTATTPAALNQRLDQLVMGAFLPPHLLGLYAVAVTWSMAVTPLSNAMGHVILPRLASTTNSVEARARLGESARAAAGTGVLIGLLFFAVTPIAMHVLFGAAFMAALPATLVLIVAAVVLGTNQLLEEALRGLGRPGLAGVAELAGVSVTVPALYVLLPRWDIVGAAVASLLAYIATCGLLSALLWHYEQVPPQMLFLPRISDVRRVSQRLGLHEA